MNRRGFFSLLLAPFLARFRKWFPKRSAVRPFAPTPVQVQRLELCYQQVNAGFQFGFTGYKAAVLHHDLFEPSPYWHGQSPWFFVESKGPYPWEPVRISNRLETEPSCILESTAKGSAAKGSNDYHRRHDAPA